MNSPVVGCFSEITLAYVLGKGDGPFITHSGPAHLKNSFWLKPQGISSKIKQVDFEERVKKWLFFSSLFALALGTPCCLSSPGGEEGRKQVTLI